MSQEYFEREDSFGDPQALVLWMVEEERKDSRGRKNHWDSS